LVMMWLSGPISDFVERHPGEDPGARVLILVGMALVAERRPHSKGYLYFAMAFGAGGNAEHPPAQAPGHTPAKALPPLAGRCAGRSRLSASATHAGWRGGLLVMLAAVSAFNSSALPTSPASR
jgi:hypothetical protein